MNASIRSAEAADERDLLALLYEYEAALPTDLRHGLVDEIVLASMRKPPNATVLATIDADVIACGFLKHLDDSTAVIQRLYVRPHARGSGLGRALMEALIECARTAGYRRVVLDTQREALPEAYRLYEKLGFRECAPFMPVTYNDATFMELPLTQ